MVPRPFEKNLKRKQNYRDGGGGGGGDGGDCRGAPRESFNKLLKIKKIILVMELKKSTK